MGEPCVNSRLFKDFASPGSRSTAYGPFLGVGPHQRVHQVECVQAPAQAILRKWPSHPLQLIDEALAVLRGNASAAPLYQGIPSFRGLDCLLEDTSHTFLVLPLEEP